MLVIVKEFAKRGTERNTERGKEFSEPSLKLTTAIPVPENGDVFPWSPRDSGLWKASIFRGELLFVLGRRVVVCLDHGSPRSWASRNPKAKTDNAATMGITLGMESQGIFANTKIAYWEGVTMWRLQKWNVQSSILFKDCEGNVEKGKRFLQRMTIFCSPSKILL